MEPLKYEFLQEFLKHGIITVNPKPAAVPFLLNWSKLMNHKQLLIDFRRFLKASFDDMEKRNKICAGINAEGLTLARIMNPQTPVIKLSSDKNDVTSETEFFESEVFMDVVIPLYSSLERIEELIFIKRKIQTLDGIYSEALSFLSYIEDIELVSVFTFEEILDWLMENDYYVINNMNIGISREIIWEKLKVFTPKEPWGGCNLMPISQKSLGKF